MASCYSNKHRASFLTFLALFVNGVSGQGCSRIGLLGVAPFCSGSVNPPIKEWGDLDIASNPVFLGFINELCDDETIELNDKEVSVDGCGDAAAGGTVAVFISRYENSAINTTVAVYGAPDQECAKVFYCLGSTEGQTLEEKFDYDCSNIEGGTISETCSGQQITVPKEETNPPTVAPTDPPTTPEDATGQAPDSTVFVAEPAVVEESEGSGAISTMGFLNVIAATMVAVLGFVAL